MYKYHTLKCYYMTELCTVLRGNEVNILIDRHTNMFYWHKKSCYIKSLYKTLLKIII